MITNTFECNLTNLIIPTLRARTDNPRRIENSLLPLFLPSLTHLLITSKFIPLVPFLSHPPLSVYILSILPSTILTRADLITIMTTTPTTAPATVKAAAVDISLDHPRLVRTDPESIRSFLRRYDQ